MIKISSIIPGNKCPRCNTLLDRDFMPNGEPLYNHFKTCECENTYKIQFRNVQHDLMYSINRLKEIQIQLFVHNDNEHFKSMIAKKGEKHLKVDIKKLEENPTLEEAERLANLYFATEAFL